MPGGRPSKSSFEGASIGGALHASIEHTTTGSSPRRIYGSHRGTVGQSMLAMGGSGDRGPQNGHRSWTWSRTSARLLRSMLGSHPRRLARMLAVLFGVLLCWPLVPSPVAAKSGPPALERAHEDSGAVGRA